MSLQIIKQHANFMNQLLETGFLDLAISQNGKARLVACFGYMEFPDVARLFSDRAKRLMYFYFDFNNTEKQTALGMLRSILAQLYFISSYVPPSILSLVKRKKLYNAQVLIAALIASLEPNQTYYIILDALDKSWEWGDLMEVISELADKRVNNLHLLMTSRKEQQLEEILNELATYINLHVRNCLNVDRRLKKWPDSIRKEIEVALTEGAQGMFRWVVCQLDTLRRCMRVFPLREALKQLPRTLDATYDRILQGIPEEYKKEAYAALNWLAFSERPLRLEEVAEAAVMEPHNCSLDPENRLPSPDDILEICSSLVICVTVEEIGGEGQHRKVERHKQLRFAHFSVKEYLVSDRIRTGPVAAFALTDTEAHQFIGTACVSYFLLLNHHDSISEDTLRSAPMLQYSAEHWPKHIRNVELEAADTKLLILKLLNPSAGYAYANWLRLIRPDALIPNATYQLGKTHNLPSPIYCAEYFGLSNMFDSLLDLAWAMDGNSENYPLNGAGLRSYSNRARLLLERGGNLYAPTTSLTTFNDCQLSEGPQALHLVACRGDHETVSLLLQKGAATEVYDSKGNTALHYAVEYGHENVVQLLLEHGAHFNNKTRWDTPLLLATRYNRSSAIVRLLLASGAAVNTQDDRDDTPLHAAIMRDNNAVLLLRNGAAIDANDYSGQTPLQEAVIQKRYDNIHLLLQSGANINIADIQGSTPLHTATILNAVAIVLLLLRRGANINAQNSAGETALIIATGQLNVDKHGHAVLIKRILEKGADTAITAVASGDSSGYPPASDFRETTLDRANTH
ncbi:MAG: hypothetical protein M1836_003367 [Candelina mexicana]|nr:MAG: hypothetical protein M1836_003367 [Candelina mexicana]